MMSPAAPGDRATAGRPPWHEREVPPPEEIHLVQDDGQVIAMADADRDYWVRGDPLAVPALTVRLLDISMAGAVCRRQLAAPRTTAHADGVVRAPTAPVKDLTACHPGPEPRCRHTRRRRS